MAVCALCPFFVVILVGLWPVNKTFPGHTLLLFNKLFMVSNYTYRCVSGCNEMSVIYAKLSIVKLHLSRIKQNLPFAFFIKRYIFYDQPKEGFSQKQ